MRAAGLMLLASLVAVSAQICDVTKPPFSAKGDNKTDDVQALQNALDAATTCSTVLLPQGYAFLTHALNLTSMSGRVLLILGQLVVWRDPKTYGSPNMFLFSDSNRRVDGLTITGGGSGLGAIIGGGKTWWPLGKNRFRPHTLYLPLVDNLTISNFTIHDSPSWNMGLRGNNILVEGMTILAGSDSCGGFGNAPNTDGFNVGGVGIVIRNAHVHNGDDCVPVTTGPDGNTSNVRVSNIHCECGTNGGVIYNQGGVVSDVVFSDMIVRGTNQGAGVKIARPGYNATGGLVTNITWQNIVIEDPRNTAIYANVFQEDAAPGQCKDDGTDKSDWLTVTDIMLRNISATVPAAQYAGCFACTRDRPCANWTFQDVTVTVGALSDTGREVQPAAPYTCIHTVGFKTRGSTTPLPCS